MALVTGMDWLHYILDNGLTVGSVVSTAAFTGLGAFWMYMTWRSGEKMFNLNKKNHFRK
jgi:hypothetical protein